MKKLFSSPLAVLAVMFVLSCFSDPAEAALFTRTWVSGTGDDTSTTCSRTAPCKTFAAAIATTGAGGQINCLDPAGFGALTINKSITIDCHEELASILVNGTNGITIDFDAFVDSLKMVNLRNLGIDGSGASGVGITISGNGTGTLVSIEDCFVNRFAGGGIVDGRTNGALTVSNTTVKNSGVGISMASAGGGTLYETLTNVRVDNASYGIIAGGGAFLQINRSVISHNASAGLYAVNSAVMDVNHSAITQNVVGVVISGAIIRLSDDDISFNQGWQGTAQSYGNNRATNTPNLQFTTVTFE